MIDGSFQFSVPHLRSEEQTAVIRVLSSGQLANGPEAAAFEAEMATGLAGTTHAVTVSSGTTALELALQAMDVGPGTEVITTPFTFAATVNAVLRCGASVVFADITDDYTIDPAAVGEHLSARTCLILPVHLYGLPADMVALSAHGIPVLEDAAQAHLGRLGDNAVGSLGLASCFSFYPTKNMTTGEGGAVATDDEGIAERVRVLRNQGMRGRYEHLEVGTNARMGELQAAIGRVQLRRLPGLVEARRQNAGRYLVELADLDWLRLPPVPDGRAHAWNQFTVQVNHGISREDVVAHLARQGVPTAVYYPALIPDLPLYRDHPLVDTDADCPRARAAATSVFSLPVHPDLRPTDLEQAVGALADFRP